MAAEKSKQEEFTLEITSENVVSTDKRFTMDDLDLGDNYKPLDAYMERKDGTVIRLRWIK